MRESGLVAAVRACYVSPGSGDGIVRLRPAGRPRAGFRNAWPYESRAAIEHGDAIGHEKVQINLLREKQENARVNYEPENSSSR